MKILLFEKTYSDESLIDLPEDVGDAVSVDYSDTYKKLPQDEHGYRKGSFKVTIEWVENE